MSNRLHAKNFTFTWVGEEDKEKIKEAIQENFPEATATVDQTENGIEANLRFAKQKYFNKEEKKLRVGGIIPTVRTWGSLFTMKPQENDPVIIRDHSFLKKFGAFVREPNYECMTDLAKAIELELQGVQIAMMSEYILTSVIVSFAIKFGKEQRWKNFQIISVDCKMEERVGGVLKNFRCDLVFIAFDRLFIMEHKFRKDRYNNQAKKALKTIRSREYSKRVIKFLRRAMIFDAFKEICEVGVGCSLKDGNIRVGILFNLKEINFN